MSDLNRLRELAGTGAPKSTENITGNMYELRDMLNESLINESKNWTVIQSSLGRYRIGDSKSQTWHPVTKLFKSKEEAQDWLNNWKKENVKEAAKPDFADIDGDGDKEEDMKDAAKNKEKTDEAVEIEEGEKPDFLKKDDDEDDKDKTDESYDHLDEMGKFIKMAEWANSPGNQYEDRGHYQEQPEGETVDLSLRRYLNADAHPVKIEEDIDPENLIKDYKSFKGSDSAE